MEITVYGRPAPKGSKRAVGRTKAGRAILVESSTRAKPWETKVCDAAVDAIGALPSWTPIAGPVSVEIVFTVAKPKSAPKRRVTWPVTRASGDLDKLARCAIDGLVEAGVMGDDSQVVELTATKAYPEEGYRALRSPGAWIDVVPLHAEEVSQ